LSSGGAQADASRSVEVAQLGEEFFAVFEELSLSGFAEGNKKGT